MEPIGMGATGDLVREIQRLLNLSGFRDDDGNRLDEDGEWGPLTQQAVDRYQLSRGIGRTGLVGDETLAALRRDGQLSSGSPLPLRALAQMEAFLAARITENLGRNRGAPAPGQPADMSVDAINAFAGLVGEAWCSSIVWCAYVRAGYPKPQLPPGFPLVANVVAWARRKGYLVDVSQPGNAPQPGDIWTTGSEADPPHMHTGMVRTVDIASRTITTIEGNCDNAVRSRTRSWGSFSHVIRVPG